MGFVTVDQENSTDIQIYYEDQGTGDPIVLIHGYPFSGTAWEKQVPFLLDKGFRVITYDRRGFGRSSRPGKGYDYDTFASDLNELMTTLDLRNAVLVGHSMGTGEVTRFISRYGQERVRGGILVSPIPPFLLKTPDNPRGIEQKVFDGFIEAIEEDRYSFMNDFLEKFYNLGPVKGKVSEEKLRADFNLGVSSSPIAFRRCVDTWLTDFRPDLTRLTLPILVIQGDADKILPIEVTGKLIPGIVDSAKLRIITGGSHGIPWTHAEEVTSSILDFAAGLGSEASPSKDASLR